MHECMPRHPSAGSWLHPRKKMQKNLRKITHIICLQACKGIPQLEASCTWGKKMHSCMLGTPFRSVCVEYFKVSPNKVSACLCHACTSRLRLKNTILRCAVNQLRSATINARTNHDVVWCKLTLSARLCEVSHSRPEQVFTIPEKLLPGTVTT